MAHTSKDGKQFTNRTSMIKHERRSAPEQKASPRPAAAQPESDETDPQSIAEQHGPAHEIHIQHDHEGGKHSVHSKHPDGHEHQSEHQSVDEAHDHAHALAGHEKEESPEYEAKEEQSMGGIPGLVQSTS